MKRYFSLLLTPFLFSCGLYPTVPIEQLEFRVGEKPAKHLVVLLSGRGATASYFKDNQWVELARQQGVTTVDFVAPHADRVVNAHVYHTEVPGRGHAPPGCLEDIEDRLALLLYTGCNWWTLEVREVEGLLQTKRIVEEYLTRAGSQRPPAKRVA